MSRATQVPVASQHVVAYGAVTLSGRSFQIVRLTCWLVTRRPYGQTGPTTPPCKHDGLGSSAFARRYWRNHYCFLFLRVLRWFTSPGCLRQAYVFSLGFSGISLSGLPHSDILGSKPVCGSPKLIAAYHVLHRLLAPRHSPYALSSLTKCSLHLTFHEYVVKKLPIAEYSVVKKPLKTCSPCDGPPSPGLPTVATLVVKRCEGWRIPGSNR